MGYEARISRRSLFIASRSRLEQPTPVAQTREVPRAFLSELSDIADCPQGDRDVFPGRVYRLRQH